MKPRWVVSSWVSRSRTMPMTTSSGTSSPASRYSAGLLAELRAGPDRGPEHVAGGDVRHDVVARQPDRLGPLSRPLLAEDRRAGRYPGNHSVTTEEALVVAQHQLAVDLLHGLEGDADGDEQGRAGERIVLDVPEGQHDRREQGDQRQAQSARAG